MHKLLAATPAYGRGRTAGRRAVGLALAALALVFLLAPALHAAGAARANGLPGVVPMAGLTSSLFAAGVLPAVAVMLVSFVLALAAGVWLLVMAELLWRSNRPDSRR